MISKQDTEKLVAFFHIFNAPTEFQVVERLDGMRFIIYPNENCGHNKGHIHIESSGAEIEIDLDTFEVMNVSGKMNKHKLKVAKKFVEENQQLFIEHWNEFTNGVKIPA